MRVDTQTILTIHNSIITRNQRVSLSHREHKEWKLHIANVQEVDRGWYMCQVNTDPMRSKRGYLEVQGRITSFHDNDMTLHITLSTCGYNIYTNTLQSDSVNLVFANWFTTVVLLLNFSSLQAACSTVRALSLFKL